MEALRAVRSRLDASAIKQQALAGALSHSTVSTERLPSAAIELLAALREVTGAGEARGTAATGEGAACESNDTQAIHAAVAEAEESKLKAIDLVKKKAAATFLKLKAEADAARQELVGVQAELARERNNRECLETAAERASVQESHLRGELEDAQARANIAHNEAAVAVAEVKARVKHRFVAMQAQHSEQATLVESIQAQLQAEITSQQELREANEAQEAAAAAVQSETAAAASELQERLNDAQHELQLAQNARDAALVCSERDAASAVQLESECESLLKQRLDDATLRERTLAELSEAETRHQELAAEIHSLMSERQHAQAVAVGRDEERHRCSVLEEECEERRAELASKQNKIKSLQREVKRLEQLANWVKDGQSTVEAEVTASSNGSGQALQVGAVGMVPHKPADNISNSAVMTSTSAEAAGLLRRQVCSTVGHALLRCSWPFHLCVAVLSTLR